jgi:uncharacterized phage infection (PIP) family protein YhgE
MDQNIKEAFNKVKEDIDFLKRELNETKEYSKKTREGLVDICDIIKDLGETIKNIKNSSYNHNLDTSTHLSTQKEENKTISTHNSTHNANIKPLNDQIQGISTGNQGVQTDRQTDRQTLRQTTDTSQLPIKREDCANSSSAKDYFNSLIKRKKLEENKGILRDKKTPKIYPPLDSITDNFFTKEIPKKEEKPSINDAVELLDSLDSIKKELRLKFKRLTEQELLVFSKLYQLDEEIGHTDYKTLAKELELSESSIRDYISRLITKGIPVDKNKINNKSISLTISPNLKKIATLSTILQLRDL